MGVLLLSLMQGYGFVERRCVLSWHRCHAQIPRKRNCPRNRKYCQCKSTRQFSVLSQQTGNEKRSYLPAALMHGYESRHTASIRNITR